MSNNTISDERTEMMAVSPNTSMLQTAQFLLPSLSMEAPTPNRPSKPTSIISSHPTPLQQVNFFGWASPQPKWKDWVDSMKPGRQKAHEHEAFLAYWLSKYIFASVNNTILHETFELAILLARGQKIAMAPAVLATLYRDLHILQSAILDVHEGVTEMVSATVFSPMLYLQAWVWERFPCVRPFDLDNTRSGETRLARWARLDNRDINFGTLESVLGSEHFVWRPYVKDTNHFLALKVYNGNGLSRIIDNEAVESFARQFGYCQDIPAEIIQAEDDKDAWDDYSTPLSTGYVYVPSRDLQGHATIWNLGSPGKDWSGHLNQESAS
ncbi:hypothetical protein QVD17_14096 [Tagetes erecta]|uniref:Aminotransferase-like plant mobile domain-containing protein n=1 Tax=Tagetes erecta TaxID=13708 RepID=A0AAD8P2H0_TARER|nr:hypothetical protein QVD17_14096 [Tagetes erecta]